MVTKFIQVYIQLQNMQFLGSATNDSIPDVIRSTEDHFIASKAGGSDILEPSLADGASQTVRVPVALGQPQQPGVQDVTTTACTLLRPFRVNADFAEPQKGLWFQQLQMLILLIVNSIQ